MPLEYVQPSLLSRLKMCIHRLFAKKQPSPYRLHAEREAYKIDMEAERHNAKISIWEERRIMWAQRYGNDSGFDPEAYERHNI